MSTQTITVTPIGVPCISPLGEAVVCKSNGTPYISLQYWRGGETVVSTALVSVRNSKLLALSVLRGEILERLEALDDDGKKASSFQAFSDAAMAHITHACDIVLKEPMYSIANVDVPWRKDICLEYPEMRGQLRVWKGQPLFDLETDVKLLSELPLEQRGQFAQLCALKRKPQKIEGYRGITFRIDDKISIPDVVSWQCPAIEELYSGVIEPGGNEVVIRKGNQFNSTNKQAALKAGIAKEAIQTALELRAQEMISSLLTQGRIAPFAKYKPVEYSVVESTTTNINDAV